VTVRFQTAIERLLAKGYTVRLDSRALRIHDKNDALVFEMALPIGGNTP